MLYHKLFGKTAISELSGLGLSMLNENSEISGSFKLIM